eukprot:5525213-Pyramimonas_sp.AAC.1
MYYQRQSKWGRPRRTPPVRRLGCRYPPPRGQAPAGFHSRGATPLPRHPLPLCATRPCRAPCCAPLPRPPRRAGWGAR